MNKIEFSILVTVTDGNPNGNPDGLNLPRQDTETGQGLISDVKTKRLIRNFLTLTKEDVSGYEIQITEGTILNELQEAAYAALESEGKVSKGETSKEATAKGKAWMCAKYFDARTFGAVMSTGDKQETAEESEEAEAEAKAKIEAEAKAKNGKKEKKPKGTIANCGQVNGPVQIMFGRSVDRITPEEHLISRCAATNAKDADLNGKNQTFGRKATVPFALFRINGFVNPFRADKTGFTDADLRILWEAILNAWELSRSANSGLVSVRALYVWEHSSKLGSAPAHKTLETLQIKRSAGVEVARSWYDYEITLDAPPKGVTVVEMVDGVELELSKAA